MSGYDTSRLHGGWHEDYERGRPGWPAAAVEWVGLRRDADVLELGAGTGKLTRVLRPSSVIETDEGMRRVLRRTCPRVDVLEGTAEAIPLADDSVDAVCAGEAFAEFANPQELDRDALLAFFSSMGWLSERTDRAAILMQLDALLTQPSDRRLWRTRAHATRVG